MAIERFWERIDPVPFTADGQEDGIVTIEDTFCFKVKQKVTVNADGFGTLRLEVKRVISKTQMRLGPIDKNIKARQDMSAYILALNPTIKAPEQQKVVLDEEDRNHATYEQEPTVAWRVLLVDKYGRPYTEDNPIPTDDDEVIADIKLPNKNGIAVENIPTKNDIVSFTFPDSLQFYKIKARKAKDVLRVGLSEADINNGIYWTIEFGNEDSPILQNDFPNGYTLYFQSVHKNDVDVEIFYWYFN